MQPVSAAHPGHKGLVPRGHAAAASSALQAGLLHEQHQPRQSGDKVTEIADTAPQLEKAPRWPKKKKKRKKKRANFFPHHVLIYTAVMSWKKFRAFSCKK